MKNIAYIPMTNPSTWQLSLLALDCAASALATLEVQGVDVRPTTSNAAFAPFAVAGSVVASELTAVKRDRAHVGMAKRGVIATAAPGSSAWSPPN